MPERNIARDFLGLTGMILALLAAIIPHVGGMDPELVAAALVLRDNWRLFLLVGWIGFFVAVFNLVGGKRVLLPRLFYAGPFFIVFTALCLWAICAVIGKKLPSHGIIDSFRTLWPVVKASPEARLLWVAMLVGSLAGWAGSNRSINRAVLKQFAVVLALAFLCTVSAELTPNFLSFRYLWDLFLRSSIVGIVALGMTFVVASGGIDFSVGALAMLLASIAPRILDGCTTILGSGYPVEFCVFIVVLLLGSGFGFFSGVMISRLHVAPFIFTFGMMAIYRAAALYVGAEEGVFPKAVSGSLLNGEIPYPTLLYLVLTACCAICWHRTRFGRYVRAVGSNEEAAIFSAIDVDRVKIYSYTLLGVLTGVSSFFLASRFNSFDSHNMGTDFAIAVIAAVLIGGTPIGGGSGSIWGTFLGAVVLGVSDDILEMLKVSPCIYDFAKGVIVVAFAAHRNEKR